MSAISAHALEFARATLTHGTKRPPTNVAYEHSIQPTFAAPPSSASAAVTNAGADWLTRRRNAGTAVASLISGVAPSTTAAPFSTRWSQSKVAATAATAVTATPHTIGGDELLFAPASYTHVAAQVEGYVDNRQRDAVTVYDLMRDAYPNYWKGWQSVSDANNTDGDLLPDRMRVANAVLLTHASMGSKFKNPEGDVFAAERTHAAQSLIDPRPAPSSANRMSFADAMNATHAALVQMGAGVNHRQSDVFNYMMQHNLEFRDFVRWMGQDPVRHRHNDMHYDHQHTKRRRIEADATCELIKRYADGTVETVDPTAATPANDNKQYTLPLEWFIAAEEQGAPPPAPQTAPLAQPSLLHASGEEDDDFDLEAAVGAWNCDGGGASGDSGDSACEAAIPVVSVVSRVRIDDTPPPLTTTSASAHDPVSVKNVFESRGCSRWRARVERMASYFAERHGVDILKKFFDIVRTKQSSSEADTHMKPMMRLAVGGDQRRGANNKEDEQDITCISDTELEKVVILAMMDLDRASTDTPIAFPKSHYAGSIAIAILERFAFRLQVMQDGNRPLALMSDCVHVQILTNHIVTVTLPALCAQNRVRSHDCRFIRNVEVSRTRYKRRCTASMNKEIEDEMQRSVRMLRESEASEAAIVRSAVQRSDHKTVPIGVGRTSMSLLDVVRYVAPDTSAIVMCFRPMVAGATNTEVLACMELMAKHKDATTPIILAMIKVLVPLVLSDDIHECRRAVDVFINSIPGDDVFFTAWTWVRAKCDHPTDFKQGIAACRAFDLLRVARTRHLFLKSAGFMVGI